MARAQACYFSSWHRWISFFCLTAVAQLLFPVVLIGACLYLYTGWPAWNWLSGLSVLYMILAWVMQRYYRRRSWHLGLRYYYLTPIHPVLCRMLVRQRKISSRYIYQLHVNRAYLKKHVRTMKGALQGMRADIKRISDPGWGHDPLFFGNTYAGIGQVQIRMIRELADFDVFPGVMVPLQQLSLSRTRMLKEQQELFGKVYGVPEQISWQIYLIRPNKLEGGLGHHELS